MEASGTNPVRPCSEPPIVFYEADFMRMTRSLLLAGTMLPALVLSDLSAARSLSDGGRIELAQREDAGEGPRGGGRGPGGPGGLGGAGPAERGGVERGGP
ncbi:hypothetical protein MetexDRAFT_6832, partial [Methylorubrum extorquens DSM 13060]